MNGKLITSTMLISLSALILGQPLFAPEHIGTDTPAAEPTAASPTITYRDPPTPEAEAMLDWAIDRYREAGLRLPDVTIAFPTTCLGADGRHLAGRYLPGRDEIELCRPSRKLALHEFAHAWDHHSTIDRSTFLQLRGLDHWYEDPGRDAIESGGEQLARIITWGLMDIDITWPVSEYAGQPVDERPRVLPDLEDCTRADLTELFVLITGRTPLSSGATT